MRRRRNPGVLDWCSAHPWMTFFLASAALTIPVAIVQAIARPAPAPPSSPPADPFGRLPATPPTSPTPSTVVVDGDPPTVFVPGVFDTHV